MVEQPVSSADEPEDQVDGHPDDQEPQPLASVRWGYRSKLWIPLASLVVAAASVIAVAWANTVATKAGVRTSQFEVTYDAKRTGYAQLIATVHQSFYAACEGNPLESIRQTDLLEYQYYMVEPFLRPDVGDTVWSRVQRHVSLCREMSQTRPLSAAKLDDAVVRFTVGRDSIKMPLKRELFRGAAAPN